MNLLRKYIRELLAEAAQDLSEFEKRNYYVAIQDDGSAFEIKLYDFNPALVGPARGQRGRLPDNALGVISAMAATGNEMGECLDAYTVTWSSVKESGWGPFLYDLAMEVATSKGSGLTPDRDTVSYDADRVWNYYFTNRADVEQVQLDDLEDHLTPGNSNDNCSQQQAYARGIKGGTFWDEDNEETPWDPYGKDVLLKSPQTKMYRWKGADNIAAIQHMGRWVEL